MLKQEAPKQEEAIVVPEIDEKTKDSLAFLREAVNAPTREEVKDIFDQLFNDNSRFGKIELKKDEETIVLEDAPRHYLFEDVLTAVNNNIPAALIGPAGSGKSTLAEQVAKALELKYFLQNSVTGTHELAGYMDAYGKYNTTSFREAFEHGGLVLIDEVDTSDPGALKWINTALANGHAMFPDRPNPVHRHVDFRIMIAANTFGTGADRIYVGANQLDASTLDRFVFFEMQYDQRLEKLLADNIGWTQRVQNLRSAAEKEKARVVISPRASIMGAKLLRAGWTQSKVEERVIWKGMDPELRERIEKKAKGGK